MQLTTRSRYGLRMLLDIALHGDEGPVRIQDIAKRRGISVKYLEQLIRALKKAGFINSKRGPKGGHVLAKPAASITVGDIVRALEEWVVLKGCSLSKDTCASCSRVESCRPKEVWERANAAMFETLDAYTLQSLLK